MQSVENSRTQLADADALANNEKAQIQKDEEKEQSDIQKEEKMIRDLEESILQAEQELRQDVSRIFNRPLW